MKKIDVQRLEIRAPSAILTVCLFALPLLSACGVKGPLTVEPPAAKTTCPGGGKPPCPEPAPVK